MRKVLFRAKSFEFGQWITGSLLQFTNGSCSILAEDGSEWRAVPETVGQYTGIQDKNGVMVFEGDITRNDFGDVTMICTWDDDTSGFILESKQGKFMTYHTFLDQAVIGNIHDNPELLTEAEK